MANTSTTAAPPDDYLPGQWIEDTADAFYVPPELRDRYADPSASPSSADNRKLYTNGVTVDRIIRAGKGFKLAPPIENHDPLLRAVRPFSPDRVTVSPDDQLHVSYWRHRERLRWAKNRLEVEKRKAEVLARQRHCRICDAILFGAGNVPRPWGSDLYCPACNEARIVERARRHYNQYKAAFDADLAES